MLIRSESYTVGSVGTAGATGTGVTLSGPLTAAYAAGAAVRLQGTGITLGAALSSAHAQGAATRGIGTGITFAPALSAPATSGAAVSTPGSGLTLATVLTRSHAAGAGPACPVSSLRTTSEAKTGAPSARASAAATVDLPVPLNPLMAISAGRTVTAAAVARSR